MRLGLNKRLVYSGIILLVVCLIPPMTSAQNKVASFELPEVDVEIVINGDGSVKETTQVSLKILDSDSLKKFSTFRFEYSPEIESFKIENAFLENEGKRFVIDTKNIIETPTLNKELNNIARTQVAINFSEAKLNSVLVFKYSKTTKPINTLQSFSTEFMVGKFAKEYNTKIKIISSKKIIFKVLDAENVIKYEESKLPPTGSMIKFWLIRPTQTYEGALNPSSVTSIQITTSSSWEELSSISAPAYYSSLKNSFIEVESIDKKSPVSIINKELNFTSDGSAFVKVEVKKKINEVISLKKNLLTKTNEEAADLLTSEYSVGEKKIIKDFKIEWSEQDPEELNYSGKYHAVYSKNAILLPELKEYNKLFEIHAEPVFKIDASAIPNIDHTYFYKNAFAVGDEPLYCDIRADWINATRSIQYLSDGILIKDSVQLLKREFSEKDVNNENFQLLSQQIRRCFLKNIMQVTFQSKKHLVVTKVFEDSLNLLPLKEKLKKRIEKVIEIDNCCDKSNNMHKEMIRVLLERNIKDDPSYVPSYQFFSYYYQNPDNENLKMALKFLDTALTYEPGFTEGLISKAVVLCKIGKCDEGRKIIVEKVLIKDVKQFSYYAVRGLKTYFIYDKNWKQVEIFSDLLFQKADTKYQRSEVFGFLGASALNSGNYNECIKYFTRAVEADEDSSCNYFLLGQCYLGEKDYVMAAFSLENALSKKDTTQFRSVLAQTYISNAMEFEKKNDKLKAKELIEKSFEVSKDWQSSLLLLKSFYDVNKKEESIRAALRATELFEGDPKLLSGYIIQNFKVKDEKYSAFMRRVISSMSNKYDALELSYYVAYEVQNYSEELQSWKKESLKNISQLKAKMIDKEMISNLNILATKFYLLSLNQTRTSSDLLKANEYIENAKKDYPKNKNLREFEHNVQIANQMLGKDAFFWETRVKLENNYGIVFPKWVLIWMYGY